MSVQPVKVTLYRWTGAWGPFKVKIPCGECSLTSNVIKDTFEQELAGVPVQLDVREWLNEWWRPPGEGGWHAPIVGPKTPITLPQTWIEGRYIGGADKLSDILHRPVEANPDRGQCSLSAQQPTAA